MSIRLPEVAERQVRPLDLLDGLRRVAELARDRSGRPCRPAPTRETDQISTAEIPASAVPAGVTVG